LGFQLQPPELRHTKTSFEAEAENLPAENTSGRIFSNKKFQNVIKIIPECMSLGIGAKKSSFLEVQQEFSQVAA